ncbi:aldehyde dehydrogenase family protein [Algoriphagus sediminis]|uniref:Aldehyde dehydrogenase n=1 Tax=Algoriphagus sediminis TaxID=3057113 RepID=A0ABT7YB95_9BACT|nr:aldehyde dehydrogenase family protein [Algoriphagus sediminis]MDN3203787.1 aldehyde dehydrogenase family protein [Algoriphagus sediminis]
MATYLTAQDVYLIHTQIALYMLTAEKKSLDLTQFEKTFKNLQNTALQWRRSKYEERAERLRRLRKWILNNRPEIQKAVFSDFRKSPEEVDISEIYPVTSELKHTLSHLKSWMKGKSLPTPMTMIGTKASVMMEPKGVSLIISPWNYPFNLAVGPLVSAIAAGCPVILKPSEMTPHTSEILQRMVSEVFEPHEVALFQGDTEVAKALLELPFDHIFFTGSPQVGKSVMKAASKNLTSVTLELGGKSPAFIQNGADLTDAADKIIVGKFLNCGQTCVAPDYILVHEQDKDAFLDNLKVGIQKFYDSKFEGIDKNPDYARIVNDKHFNRLVGLIENSIDQGAKVEFGGQMDPQQRYIEPTILSQVNLDMEVMQEEIFGPILPVITYDDLDQAIALVNSFPKPLALYYFGEDKSLRDKVLEETSSGNTVVNDCVIHFIHTEMPFGGVNNSGIGKAHGYFGFQAFSNEKGVLTQRVGVTSSKLINPPYNSKTRQAINLLLKWF